MCLSSRSTKPPFVAMTSLLLLAFILASCGAQRTAPLPGVSALPDATQLPTPTPHQALSIPKYTVILPACPTGNIADLNGTLFLIDAKTYYLHVWQAVNPPPNTATSSMWADDSPTGNIAVAAESLPPGPLRDNLTTDAIGLCDHRSSVPVIEQYAKTY